MSDFPTPSILEVRRDVVVVGRIMHGFPVISVVSGRDLRIQAAAESINGPVDNTAPPIGRIYLVALISCLRENRRRNPR